MALARVVAQQEVETTAGWLHPSSVASSEVRNASADAAGQDQSVVALDDWRARVQFEILVFEAVTSTSVREAC